MSDNSFDTDSSHLSDTDLGLLIDEYAGEVESQFAKASFMREYARVRPVRGTDTLVNNRVGRTSLQAIVPGVRPDAIPTAFGRVRVTVDTTILARDNRSMLNELQLHFDARMELAQDHGKEIGKFFDQAFIIQVIKGSEQAAPTGTLEDGTVSSMNGAFNAGVLTTLVAPGDENDPDKLETAIHNTIVAMELNDIDVEDLVVLVNPTRYQILLQNDKLLDTRFSDGNGNFADAKIMAVAGARIIKTNRIPTAAIPAHPLSNANNGNAYNVSSAEANTVAVIMHPKSLLAGETIPLTSDIWFNREEKQWFIDSFIAFGVTVNRPDVCGSVRHV